MGNWSNSPNEHGRNVACDDEICHARFPHPGRRGTPRGNDGPNGLPESNSGTSKCAQLIASISLFQLDITRLTGSSFSGSILRVSGFLEGESIIIRTVRICCIAIASMTLGACASSPSGRVQMTAPPLVSSAYSEMRMQLSLVTETNTDSHCIEECELDRAFDQSILRLGTRLVQSAYEAHPDLTDRIGKFQFTIAEKNIPGSTSSAAGSVVVFRGVQKLHLSEEALAFLLAREMGFVIGLCHDENAATSILFSILGSVFIPVSGLFGASAILAQTAATTASTTAAASVASFVGSHVVMESYKLDQLHEADAIALDLLNRLGWNKNDIADALVAITRVMGDDNWSNDLRESAEDVIKLADVKNSITALNVSNTGNGETVIKVKMAKPLDNLPTGFTTDAPPRIILDFHSTTSGLGKSVQDYPEGVLRNTNIINTNIIQTIGRTRLAVNLNRMLPYKTSIDGNSLLITLYGNIAVEAKAVDSPRSTDTDPAFNKQPETVASELNTPKLDSQEPKKQAKPDIVEKYVAQVGTYSNAATAKQKLDKLKKWGFKAYAKKIGGKVRVCVGPYTERDKVERVRQLLEKHGLHPVIATL
jgi:hypothetical protein